MESDSGGARNRACRALLIGTHAAGPQVDTLETPGMLNRFLVSTTHHLLAIDPESRSLWRVHSGAGLYFGLAKGADGLLYTACRNTVLGPQDPQIRASEEGTILVFDRELRVCGELRPPFPLRDLHGIACFDGRLWVTCAYDNMVAICDLATRTWERWYPAPNPEHRDRDIHHFNTIRFIGGHVCLLAHHFGPSELLFYAYPSLQLDSAIPFGCMSHDLFLFDNALATCSSGDGWIVNRSGQRLRTGNFPRGIAATPAGNLLGLSMHSPSDQRQMQDGILRWYASDWQFKTDYVLPRVGMVLDVLDIGDQGCQWDAVELWLHAEIAHGEYNRAAPGNVYLPISFASCTRSATLEWHAPEVTHRWTSARDTALSILINPGETRLWLEVSSGNPNPYSCEIWLDDQHLGTVVFTVPGVQRREFDILPHSAGSASLTFRVPYLWKPAELIQGSSDDRLLGLAVHLVGIR
jgi:hypothetical protein